MYITLFVHIKLSGRENGIVHKFDTRLYSGYTVVDLKEIIVHELLGDYYVASEFGKLWRC